MVTEDNTGDRKEYDGGSRQTDATAELFEIAKTDPSLAVLAAIEKGANVNAVDATTGRTALHYVAESALPRVVQTLLRHGAEVIPDHRGQTPFDLAPRGDTREILLNAIKEKHSGRGRQDQSGSQQRG